MERVRNPRNFLGIDARKDEQSGLAMMQSSPDFPAIESLLFYGLLQLFARLAIT
jgi:hypothetical protein